MENADLRPRVAVVTGAASGIGRATAAMFAARGYVVAALDIAEERLARAAAEVVSSGGAELHPVPVDVADRDRVGAVLDEVAATYGGIDAVVNCAANFLARGIDVTPEEWDAVLRVNVRGISNVVQAAHPHLARSSGAAVVNVSSVSAHVAQPQRWTYNTTKGAIVSLTKCMAMDLAADGIRVNSVSPGWIWTPEVEAAAADGGREQWEPVWGRYHLLRRLGEASEVATAIGFLCSEEASFVTGADLPVDGGYLAMGPEGLGDTSSFAGSA